MSRIVLIILCVIAVVAMYLIYAFGEPNSEEWDHFQYKNLVKEWRTHFFGGLVALAILVALIVN